MLPTSGVNARDFNRYWFTQKADYTAKLRAEETKTDMDKELMEMARRLAAPGQRLDIRA